MQLRLIFNCTPVKDKETRWFMVLELLLLNSRQVNLRVKGTHFITNTIDQFTTLSVVPKETLGTALIMALTYFIF